MEVIHTISDFRALRPKMGTVGFVPTMGNLHKGHLHLAKMARKECETVVASIFVNPAQFAPNEDLDKYPRTLESDLELLRSEGVDYVFAPTAREMYPSGINLVVAEQVGTFVEVKGKSHQMEGQIRPHFFRGVATVVLKLFNVVSPTKAYFGQKDAQQCVVVQSMVRDLLIPTEVVVGPTVREHDGLAMSSRNNYLSPEDRKAGPVLFRALSSSYNLFHQKGVVDKESLFKEAQDTILKEPRVSLEYLSLAHPDSLRELDFVGEEGAILSGAIKTSSTRLIDNLFLKKGHENQILFA